MRRILVRAAALALVAPALARAQAASPVAQVPVGFPGIGRDPALASLTHDNLARLANPHLVHTGRWRVMLSFSEWLVRADVSGPARRAIDACAGSLAISGADRERVLATNPWADFDAALSERPMLVVSVLPARGGEASCADSLADAPHLAARGIQFLDSASYTVANDPGSVSLLIDGQPAPSTLVAQAPVLGVNAQGTQDRARQLRLFVPLDVLAPDTRGRFPRIEAVISSVADAVVDTVQLADEMLRQAWRQTVPWDVERARQVAASPALSLPLPADAELRTAHEAWTRADPGAAASIARWRLTAPAADDRLFAQVVVGTTLSSAGLTRTASVVLGDALRAEPCLSLDALVDAAFRARLDAIRPAARCEAERPLKIMLQGLLGPGVGQFASGRPQWGKFFLGTTAVAFGLAGFSELATRSAYDSYQSALTSEDAVRYYRNASRAQTLARGALFTGAGLWILSAIEATVAEHRHAAHLDRVVDYGAQR